MNKVPALSETLEPVKNLLQRRYAAVGAYFDRADEKADALAAMSDPRRPLITGAVIILLAFFGLGLWVTLAPLDSAAIAPGIVMVETNRRTIQHLEGGIVEEILVKDGDRVKAGDVLVRLDDIRARASLGILQNDQDAHAAILARLQAERDNLPMPVYPEDMVRRADQPDIKALIKTQNELFLARKTSMENQKSILEQRIQQYRQQIVGLQALQTSKESQLRTIRDELNDLKGLLESGYVTKTRVLALEREAARLEGEAGDHISSIARSEQGIGETRLQILQLEKTRSEDIDKELLDNQARLTEGREKLVAARDVMKRVDIVAPVSGTVMNMQLHTKGGVIGQGAALMEIVPANDTLVVEAQVSPMDIDTVRPGLRVGLHVSAADARLVPVIFGTLDTISADRMTDQRTGIAYYKARISVSPDELKRLGDDHPLRSGMMVEAQIIRGEHTALGYLMKPLVEAFSKSFREM